MKIRLVNCNLLIAFFGNNSFAVIVANLFSARHESRVWQRASPEYEVRHAEKFTIKTPQEISLLQNIKYSMKKDLLELTKLNSILALYQAECISIKLKRENLCKQRR